VLVAPYSRVAIRTLPRVYFKSQRNQIPDRVDTPDRQLAQERAGLRAPARSPRYEHPRQRRDEQTREPVQRGDGNQRGKRPGLH